MEEKKLFLVAFLVLGVIILSAKIPITGFTTAEPSMTLDLDSTNFAQDSIIKGNINLYLNEYTSPTNQIQITLNSNTYTHTLQELLALNNYTIEYEETTFTPENEALQKNVQFNEAGSKYLGFKIPRYSEVNSASFALSGSANNGQYPSAVKLDFGSEGTRDWYYLGTFTSFSTNSIQSEDFDTTQEGTGYIRDSKTYYCEFLNLPETKHVKVTATYTKKSSNGDIKASILSVPTGNPKIGWSGGSNTCDLPETGNSCDIEMDYPIEGKYLVCIYSATQATTEENLYEIPLDTSSETDTGYTCATTQDSVCQSTDYTNFFITAYPGVYNNAIQSSVEISKWESFSNSILTALKYYVGSEPYNGLCKESMCTVPLNITSSSAGNLLFTNLIIEYESNGITQQTSMFYDLVLPQGRIKSIETQDLSEGLNLEIPIDKLNLSIPELGTYTIDVSFQNLTASNSFTIKLASEIYTPTSLIQAATTKLNSYQNENTDYYRVLYMLDKTQKIDQTIKDLTELKNQIGFTEDSKLLSEIEDAINDIPWEITASQTYSTNLVLNADEIPSSLGDTPEIFNDQEKISVKATMKSIDITNYNKESSQYLLIHKEITANEKIEGTIYEIAPYSFSNLYYTTRPDSISGTQAIYTISLSKDETFDLYYLTEESISLKDFNTIFIETEEVTTFCGDGICSLNEVCDLDCKTEESFPTTAVIIGGIIFLVIIGGLATILITKNKTPMDAFIQKAKTKGLTKDQVTTMLKKKGWSDQDIEKQLKKY
jgi:hypothetical protein